MYFSRHELQHAWHLLGRLDLSVLILVIPAAAISYLATGEMTFSYLRQKKLISHVKPWTLMRISLELNFVNHVLPSGGLSGISYMNWRLGRFGVSAGKATMAQAVRYVAGFAAMATLLALAVLLVTIDGNVNRWIILMSSILVFVMLAATLGGIYLVRSPRRIQRFSSWITALVNTVVRSLTFGRQAQLLDRRQVQAYFDEMHNDYLEVDRDRRLLVPSYLWGLLFTAMEIAVFCIVFWSLGTPVNPAPVLIAYGIASLAGFIVVTPGGAGAYEALMILVLAIAGVGKGDAIAGIMLSRIILLVTTIGLGYVFYQLSILKYGKQP